MNIPFGSLTKKLDRVHRDQPFLMRIKARMLTWFSILVVVFVPLNIGKLLIVDAPSLFVRFGFNGLFLTGAIVALWYLSRGNIQRAGNAIALILVLSVHLLLLLVPDFFEPLSVAISLYVFDVVCVLLALVFASRRVACLVLMVVVVSQVAFHFGFLDSETIPGSMHFAAGTLLRDGLIGIGFVFCLGLTVAILIETAHRQNEQNLQAIRETNEKLETLVSHRTRELQTATQLAREASSAKGEFLANMSHELRTPLHAIIAASELLLARNDLPEEASEKASLITNSGELLLRQIGDILDLAKVEAGQIELEHEPFALGTVITDCAQLMADAARNAGVQLETKLSPQLPSHVLGDQFRLRQILLNLISNAIKFTPPSGRVVTRLATERTGENPGTIRFEVEDTGIGMSQATLEKIFGRFNQADPSITRTYGGTGLGLPISQHLVQLMGGQLTAESQPDKGSTFSFTLNLEVSQAKRVPRKNLTSVEASIDFLVLAADDNSTNRKVVDMQLRKLGCRVTLADNGAEVLASLQSDTPLPDLILMDCEMPVLNGWDATRQLRAWAEDPDASERQKAASQIPVVALTAAALPNDRLKCLESGMTDYLTKPLKIATLKDMLGKFLPNNSS